MGNKYNFGANVDLLHIFIDVVSVFIACVIAWFCIHRSFIPEREPFLICCSYVLLHVVTNYRAPLYNKTSFFYLDRMLRRIFQSLMVNIAIITILVYVVSNSNVNRAFYYLFFMLAFVFQLNSALLIRYITIRIRRDYSRALLIGHPDQFELVANYLEKSNITARIVGYVSCDGTDEGDAEGYLGDIADLGNILPENQIDQIFIFVDKEMPDYGQEVVDTCLDMGLTIRVVMDPFETGNVGKYMESIGTFPVVTYHTVTLNPAARAIKRTVDIVGSLVGLIAFAPVMLATTIWIRMDSPGPALFRQKRIGTNGRIFTMYKFRSMYIDAEQRKAELLKNNEVEGNFMFKMKDDPRITPVGRFIRKTSIDELPQFLNVLFGQMSLVGTRPPTEDEVKLYEDKHWRRLSIKPGITGMWQTSGRNAITSFEEVVRLDTNYIDNWSIVLDFVILFKTVGQVFNSKNVI